jgi:aminoglycoside phosphotransferase (APT) family kinase protein
MAVLGVAPTTVLGFPSRAELKALYVDRTGRDAKHLDYYVAFGYWKVACILQGVASRYFAGAGGGDRTAGGDMFVHQVHMLGAAASAAADAAGLRA